MSNLGWPFGGDRLGAPWRDGRCRSLGLLLGLRRSRRCGNTVASQIDGAVAAKTAVTALAANTVTATTGTLQTPNGATAIANADTPTVAELLEFCMENRAKISAIIAALKA